MNLQNLIVDLIRQSTANVFSTMLGVELSRGEAFVENGTPDANDGVVSFIGLAGRWVGTGSLSCSPALACRICSTMLMMESTGRRRRCAGCCGRTDQHDHRQRQDRPRTAPRPPWPEHPHGGLRQEFQDQERRHTEWIVVRFPWDEEALMVKLCLAPSEKTHANCHMHRVRPARWMCELGAGENHATHDAYCESNRLPPRRPTVRAGKYLTFQLANEEFGIRVLKVREIMGLQEITAVPQTPTHIKGVINLRGR